MEDKETRTPSAISAECLLENEWNDVQKTVRRTVCRGIRDTVRETQKLAYAWNLHQGRIFGDIKVDVPPPTENRPPVAFFHALHQGCKHGRIQFHHLKL